ncbi:MAG: calcium/sodium antiporter [Gammaproteobacteria bacterium]|nr:calcium/sodium antiporter [Gammaproteobacteria bacterium]
MLIASLALIVGFVTLVWSADRFLNGAAASARLIGMSPLMIGLTIVSLGTSAPEIMVAVAAALNGTTLLAIGNAVGSNIANIGLVLGVAALIAPLPFARSVLSSELPWLMIATLAAFLVLFNLHLGRLEGVFLLLLLGVLMWRLIREHRNSSDVEALEPELEEIAALETLTRTQAIIWLLTGLLVLLLSAQLLVWAATEIALLLGVSELIIGLTVIAVGTSLPELAATVGSVIKGHTDIAIGNVVGSNILNILAVMALPPIIAPVTLEVAILWRDFGAMLAMTLLLLLFAYGLNRRPVITRFEGMVLLLAWIGYNTMLYMQA